MTVVGPLSTFPGINGSTSASTTTSINFIPGDADVGTVAVAPPSRWLWWAIPLILVLLVAGIMGYFVFIKK
jgi:hypothetical protein